MSKAFREYQPEQSLLLPPSLEDWLPEGHLARFISEVAGELDLEPIYRSYEEKDGRGQAAYEPLMMLKLLLYGYAIGMASSRKIEKATHDSVAFRYLAVNQHPDHDTLAEFRRRHLEALRNLFLQVLKLCQQAGLVKLGHVALDGTKVKANASRHRNLSYEKMLQQEAQLQQQVRELLDKAEQADRSEDERYGIGKTGEELPPELRKKQDRLQKIRAARAALEEQARRAAERKKAEAEQRLQERQKRAAEAGRPVRGKLPQIPDPATARPAAQDVANTTDTDSRVIRERAGGFVQGFNAQAAVDSQAQVIVAADVTSAQNDRAQLVPMVEQVETNTGSKPVQLSADTDYYSPKHIGSPILEGIDLYIEPEDPPKRQASIAGSTPPSTRDQLPKRNRKPPRSGYGPDGIPRTEHLRKKLATEEGRAIYKKRREVVEPVFGQIKQWRGFRQFLLRGLAQVQAEWKLICLTHNLLKLFRSGWAPQQA